MLLHVVCCAVTSGWFSLSLNNFHVLVTFYRLYFIIQQSHEHCNLQLLLSCNFRNFRKAQGEDSLKMMHMN